MKWLRRTPLEGLRWAVIDCETSGLDPRRDRLLSVGAVEVSGERVRPERAFYAVLRQAQPSAPQNIVIHGLGADAQLGGQPAAEVLEALAAFVADAVPVAFHAPFDAEVLRRHGFAPKRKWLDLAQLAPALVTRPRGRPEGLDGWLAAFRIAPQARHDALGDAYAAAQILLVLLNEAGRQGARTLEELAAAAQGARWLR